MQGLEDASKINAVNCVLPLEVQNLMTGLKHQAINQNKDFWSVRIGIHNGDVITGVLGTKRIAYDIFEIQLILPRECKPIANWKSKYLGIYI